MSSKSGPRIESWQSNKCVKIKSPEKVQLRRIDLRGKLEKMEKVIGNSDLEVSVLKRSGLLRSMVSYQNELQMDGSDRVVIRR